MPKRGRGETKEESNKKPSNTRANDQANRMERKRHHNGCVDHRAHKRHQPDGADFQERVKQRSARIRREKYTSIKQHDRRRQALAQHYEKQKQQRQEEAKRCEEEAKRRQEEAKRRQEEAKQRRKKKLRSSRTPQTTSIGRFNFWHGPNVCKRI